VSLLRTEVDIASLPHIMILALQDPGHSLPVNSQSVLPAGTLCILIIFSSNLPSYYSSKSSVTRLLSILRLR
jgi:hypothetical protein